MGTYFSLAKSVLEGSFNGAFYYQPFYYAVFLPVSFFIFRSAVFAVAIAQSLCGMGIVWFAGLSAAELRGRFAGVMAAFLAAFSQLLVFYVPYALIEIQQAFWFVFLFWLLLRAMRKSSAVSRRNWFLWGAAGLVLGCAILSRGNAWCFLPLAGFMLCRSYHSNGNLRHILICGAIFLACAILPQVPFIVQNTQISGTLSGPSTAGGAVLALGNNPEAPPGSLPHPYPATYEHWMKHQGEVSVFRRIWDWAKEEPFAFLELQFRKFLLFWDSREIPNNVSLETNGGISKILSLAFIPSSLLLLLTIAWVLLDWKRFRYDTGSIFTLAFILLYALATAAFYLLARFRVPLLGVLCISSALALTAGRHAIRTGTWKRPLFFLPLPVAFFIVFFAYDCYQNGCESTVMRFVRPDGVKLETSRDTLERQDAGPLFFMNRNVVDLKPGTVVEKSFSPSDEGSHYEKAVLRLEFLAEEPDDLVLVVNGVPVTIRIQPEGAGAGMVYHTAETADVVPPLNGTYQIQILATKSGKTQLLTDTTRNYGRTSVNGQPLPEEACIRLFLTR